MKNPPSVLTDKTELIPTATGHMVTAGGFLDYFLAVLALAVIVVLFYFEEGEFPAAAGLGCGVGWF